MSNAFDESAKDFPVEQWDRERLINEVHELNALVSAQGRDIDSKQKTIDAMYETVEHIKSSVNDLRNCANQMPHYSFTLPRMAMRAIARGLEVSIDKWDIPF